MFVMIGTMFKVNHRYWSSIPEFNTPIITSKSSDSKQLLPKGSLGPKNTNTKLIEDEIVFVSPRSSDAIMRVPPREVVVQRNAWIPLTEEEKQDYFIREKRVCKHPLRHCCLGQGRQFFSHHDDVSRLFTKWNKPLAKLNNLFDYLSEQNIACNIWFVGDSMSGDHAIGALCELMRDHGYQLDGKKCIPYENERWAEKKAMNCSMSKNGNAFSLLPAREPPSLLLPECYHCT
jgi:hypothetical protein